MPKGPQREWEVPVAQFTEEGIPIPVSELADRAMSELGPILMRLGGAIVIAAKRQQVADNRYETVALLYRWESYVPPDRSAAPPAPVAAEPEPEPEPDDEPEIPAEVIEAQELSRSERVAAGSTA